MKQRKKKAAKSGHHAAADLDGWLCAVDELCESMIESAGPEFETRRSLAEIFINKTFRLLHGREQPTVH